METKKLDFAETLKDAIQIGAKNAPSILAAVALWAITLWIPYLNVGTTIAISLLPTELAKGNIINPLDIFDGKYRRCMGEIFILWGLVAGALLFACSFLLFPAIVISLAWSLATYFLVERGKNPIQALKDSNDATYGSKWTMFFVQLVVCAVLYAVFFLFSWLCGIINVGVITSIVMLALMVVFASVLMAVNASFWKQLKDNVE
ncbi:MAG: hypothetical protein LBH06_07235 [Rikenellaceae bacterium]|jgi:hypothetical protein|nr:hypothetical protein [Rikenellaceae bacterium]